MKKVTIAIFLLSFLLPSIHLLACSPILIQYSIKKDSLLFHYGNKIKVVEGADAHSYKAVMQGGNYAHMSFYARDQSSVYYAGEKIEGADADSFKYLGGKFLFHLDGYCKDREHIYFHGVKIKDANTATFEWLGIVNK